MKKLILLFLSYFALQICNSQNVGIGTLTPDSSSILELNSTSKGILIPRTDTSSVNTASRPADALLIYQKSDSTFYYYDGSKWRALVYGNSGVTGANSINIKMFDIPGSYSFRIPSGVTKIFVEVWGGGGAGGPAVTSTFGVGGGGGGGGYGKSFFNVIPGTDYIVTVGQGGTAVGCINGFTTYSPVQAGTSSFGNLITANGGYSGAYILGGSGFIGGYGGVSNGNYLSFKGIDGNAGGNGPGLGGDAGTVAGTGASSIGQNGSFPGGGGAGANYGGNCPNNYGGNGASGRVIISW